MLKKICNIVLLVSIFSFAIQAFENSSNEETFRDLETVPHNDHFFSGFFNLFTHSEYVKELRGEIKILKEKLEKIEIQQKELMLSLNITKNELKSTKEEQARKVDDLYDLERILVHYGNNLEGMSALHYAIKIGDINAVNTLIAHGADVNSLEMDFRPQVAFTALMRAVSCNQTEIAVVLLNSGADVNYVPYKDSYYPIYYAAQFGSSQLVTLLISHGAFIDRVKPFNRITNPDEKPSEDTITPLHIAAKHGNYEAVVALVSCGGKVNGHCVYNGKANTPLDEAACALKYKDNTKNLDLVKFLVEHGATRRWYHNYYTDSNNSGWPPLACPVISGYLKQVGK